MRKTLSIFLIISVILALFSNTSNAQLKLPLASKSMLNKFEKSKTYFVKEDVLISDFNLDLEQAANDFWNVTGFEFISAQEFEKKSNDQSASFVYMRPVYFEEDKTKTAYMYLFLSMGSRSGKIQDMPDLCAVPLAIKGTSQEEFVYKLGLILKFFQQHIKTSKENPGMSDDKVIDYYVSQDIDLSDYELWLIPGQAEKSIKSVYPHTLKFVSKSEVSEAVESGRGDVLILHLIQAGENGYCIKIIAKASDGTPVFYDYHKTSRRKPSLLLDQDIKSLLK